MPGWLELRRPKLPFEPNSCVQCKEADLRKVLSSPSGEREGKQILDRIAQGDVVIIAKQDGRTLTLSEVHMARKTLRDVFDWRGAASSR